jgi:Leucine-rich repeat (LRR) protein
MLKRISHIILFILLCFGTAKAQYITLPDPAFVQFLVDSFPTVLNAQKQFDTTKAKTITGKIVAKNRGIVDVSGIEYFTSIKEVHFGNNKLTSFPRIDNLKSLTVLYLDTNQLTSIPDLRAVTNLGTINIYRNKLDSLPDFSNMTKLKHFLVAGNNLKKMPDFTGCTLLQHIVANDNKLSQLPDFTKHLQLDRVLFTNNQFKEVDFNLIPTVTEVRFDGNLLTKFPDLKGRTNLTELELDRNYIDSLPDLSSLVNLTILDLSTNYFTFESLAKFTPPISMIRYRYSPQRLAGKQDTVIKRQNDFFKLEWPVRNPLSTNQYTWYKDGKALTSGSSPIFPIPKIGKKDQGTYSIECRNTAYPQLVLKFEHILLRVIDCFDLGQLKLNYAASSCNYPISASVDESTFYFGRKPFSYKLRNTLSNEETNFKSSNLTIAKEGTYDFVIADSEGCEQVLKNYIQTSRPDNCDPIFYPGLNGPESSFYIEQKGMARIYNNAGHKLKELLVPAYWDGRDNNGQLLDSGLYIIIVNEQVKIPISLMRVN